MTDKYILVNKKAILTNDFHEWGRWFEENDRLVKQETLDNGYLISTVFLGIDHQFGEGKPLIFETIVFHEDESEQIRYSTWEEAEEGHNLMVEKYKGKE